MKDLLKDLLTPQDDGRAFREAVLLRATGALHRRRVAAQAAVVAPWAWLERWARPWVVAALLALAVAASLPVLPPVSGGLAEVEPAPVADLLLALPTPELVLAIPESR